MFEIWRDGRRGLNVSRLRYLAQKIQATRRKWAEEGLEKGRRAPPTTPAPLIPALLTAHCPARQELGGIASSSCGRALYCGAGTEMRSHAQPLPERAPTRVKLGLVPAGAPGMAQLGSGFWRQVHFPNPSQPNHQQTPL